MRNVIIAGLAFQLVRINPSGGDMKKRDEKLK